jgi:hypothetical protein
MGMLKKTKITPTFILPRQGERMIDISIHHSELALWPTGLRDFP